MSAPTGATAAPTCYWFDYETFGTHAAMDRPVQFAGRRTDLDLNPVGPPLTLFARPTEDYLPDPGACRVTGITPQMALQSGIPEREFIAAIQNELSYPATCNVGYNNIRFDDEFTRHVLFRNFHDPYEHEYRHGNSRWDLLDVVRMTRALRPQGLEWPVHPDTGKPSNRLEDLTRANGIEHSQAHDALADVDATIAVAGLIKRAQPRLYQFLFQHRSKDQCRKLLNLREQQAIVHVSGMLSSAYQHLSVVMPLMKLQTNNNGIVVWDLRHDPEELLALAAASDADGLATRLFTRAAELPADTQRLALKTVHVNRAPVLAPLNVLRPEDQTRLQLNLPQCEGYRQQLIAARDTLTTVLTQAYDSASFNDENDADAQLYSGGFFSEGDRLLFPRIRAADGPGLEAMGDCLQDVRGDEMLFRYRARNFPDSLDAAAKQRWHQHCVTMLTQSLPNSPRTLRQVIRDMQKMDWYAHEATLKSALTDYFQTLAAKYDPGAVDSDVGGTTSCGDGHHR